MTPDEIARMQVVATLAAHAVQPAAPDTDPDLVAQRLARLFWSLYEELMPHECQAALARRDGAHR